VAGKQAQVDFPRCDAAYRFNHVITFWCVNDDLDFQIAC